MKTRPIKAALLAQMISLCGAPPAGARRRFYLIKKAKTLQPTNLKKSPGLAISKPRARLRRDLHAVLHQTAANARPAKAAVK